MFDNVFVFLSAITDSTKNPILDNLGNPIESRTYSDLLAKFMDGIPPKFEVASCLRDNAWTDGEYSTGKILDQSEVPIETRAIFITN